MGGISLTLPFDWDCDPFGDRNWQLHLNSLRVLDRYYCNYEKKSDNGYLSYPVRLIRDYSSYHFNKGLNKKNTSFFMYDDMTCGLRQLRVGYLVDKHMAGSINLLDDDLKLLSELLYLHWSVLSDRKNFKSTNHTISLLHAIMSLVVVMDFSGQIKREWTTSVYKCFDHLVSSQFDRSGIHVENSPEYHFFVLRLFRELVKSGWYDSSASIKTLELAESMSDWMRLPDGRIIPIGDSNARPPVETSSLLGTQKIYRYKDEFLNHYLYCFIRKVFSDKIWSFLGVKSGHVIETHRHRDDLSYIWSESGADLIVDPGKYAYVKNNMRAYIKSHRAHNTVQLTYRGRSNLPQLKQGKVLDFNPSRLCPDVTSSSYGYRVKFSKSIDGFPGLLVDRVIYFRPGEWLVIEDLISGSNDDISFDIYVHFSPELRWWDSGVSNLRYSSNNLLTKEKVEFDLYLLSLSSTDVAICKSSGGEFEPEINGFISREYKSTEPSPYMKVSGDGNARVTIGFSFSGNSKLSYDNNKLMFKVDEDEYILR